MWYRVVKAAFGVAKQEKQSNDGSTVSVIAPENMSILNPGNISIINTNIDDEISELIDNIGEYLEKYEGNKKQKLNKILKNISNKIKETI
jgi:hypothetical protein